MFVTTDQHSHVFFSFTLEKVEVTKTFLSYITSQEFLRTRL